MIKKLEKSIRKITYRNLKEPKTKIDKIKRAIFEVYTKIHNVERDIDWIEYVIDFTCFELSTDAVYKDFLFKTREELSFKLHKLIQKLDSIRKKAILVE